jgi:hypothetical protein
MNMADCGCELPGHWSDCPRAWADLHTAQDIAEAREVLMTWAGGSAASPGAVARQARGITARAVELGLERQ